MAFSPGSQATAQTGALEKKKRNGVGGATGTGSSCFGVAEKLGGAKSAGNEKENELDLNDPLWFPVRIPRFIQPHSLLSTSTLNLVAVTTPLQKVFNLLWADGKFTKGPKIQPNSHKGKYSNPRGVSPQNQPPKKGTLKKAQSCSFWSFKVSLGYITVWCLKAGNPRAYLKWIAARNVFAW